jgi:hypothetical protein
MITNIPQEDSTIAIGHVRFVGKNIVDKRGRGGSNSSGYKGEKRMFEVEISEVASRRMGTCVQQIEIVVTRVNAGFFLLMNNREDIGEATVENSSIRTWATIDDTSDKICFGAQ